LAYIETLWMKAEIRKEAKELRRLETKINKAVKLTEKGEE
jgi:hypothetical protein